MQWQVSTFQQLALDQLFDFLQLRVSVFVVEQQCAYPELDEYDRHIETKHLSGHDEAGQLMAYARICPPGLRFSEASVGRFVVKKEARRQGIGHQLLRVALNEIQSCWSEQSIRISAQDYLQKFYEQYGFVRVSDVYLEDGVPHVEMVRKC
ncbi:MAG: GNAT family N-acetyltransferase [Nitrospirae bacterium]|nr:GNAT family N-acetyltransferase [Nitrospirota bacterium]MDA1303126.1 GNAT family N-acetyltransferase [Nitrospirota bacterium]